MPKTSNESSRLRFPVRLHGLLTQSAKFGVDDVISWDEEGTKFIIHKQKEFVSKILPNVFKQSKFASFRRQLNAYGFERVFLPNKLDSKSGGLISYSRGDFKRDDPTACKQIHRQYSNQGLVGGLAKLNELEYSTGYSSVATYPVDHPQECTSNGTFCVSSTKPIHEDAAIVSEDESVSCGIIPSLITSINNQIDRTKNQEAPRVSSLCEQSYMSDSVLDEMLSVFDNDIPLHVSCEST
eukprot:CAMPEP_0194211304 /NCGR_PEP_ID=MMETSP0156-20130528/9993_1 /TAXON_ID=33649 /ORGANISM="Thalassionema nitzschioides, Strain L26-B" /LENGTH=238 /DNA_ID=CAMNT_0038938815 /DNA_START=33 /DNA_END=745 /DNA_ORIENTATION=+